MKKNKATKGKNMTKEQTAQGKTKAGKRKLKNEKEKTGKISTTIKDHKAKVKQKATPKTAKHTISKDRVSDKGSVSINVQRKDYEDALIDAAYNGDLKTVSLLIDKVVNIEATDECGDTALTRAADRGHAEIVELLIAKGASASTGLPCAARGTVNFFV